MVTKYTTGPNGEPVPVHQIDISEQVKSICEAFGLEPGTVIKIELTPSIAHVLVANLSEQGSKHIVLDQDRSDYGQLDMRLERFSIKT